MFWLSASEHNGGQVRHRLLQPLLQLQVAAEHQVCEQRDAVQLQRPEEVLHVEEAVGQPGEGREGRLCFDVRVTAVTSLKVAGEAQIMLN